MHYLSKDTKSICQIDDKCYEIFKKIILLADKLNVNSALSLCNLYSYLLYTGNLSIDKKFVLTDKQILSNGALNIALGYGCCRNINDGLRRLLCLSDVENHKLVTSFNENAILITYDPIFNNPIKDVNDFKLTIMYLLKSLKNYDKSLTHSLSLVIDGDEYFCYDATWDLILKLNETATALKVVNGKGLMNIMFPRCNFKDSYSTDKTRKYLKSIKTKNNCDLKKYKNTFDTDLIKFKDNSSLIKDFHDEIKENIESICKSLKKNHL